LITLASGGIFPALLLEGLDGLGYLALERVPTDGVLQRLIAVVRSDG
jgi:hypothetical protein